MKRTLALLLALCMVLSLGVTATAAETRTITASYRDVHLVVDGYNIVPRDATGKAVQPFIYNGTTYLPVRAVADALGVSVAWDDATSTITLTSGAEPTAAIGWANTTRMDKDIQITYRGIQLVIDGKTVTPKDAAGNTVDPFIYNGTTYLPVRAVANALGVDVEWDGDTSTVYLGQTWHDEYQRETRYYYVESDGTISYDWRSTYDAQGRLTSRVNYGTENQYTWDYYCTYAPDGLWVRNESRARDGSFDKSEYTYDKNGLCVKSVYTAKDAYGSTTSSTTVHTYDENGLCIKDETTYAGDDTVYTYTYTYDANGRLVKEVDSDGNVNTYTYDARGNMTSEVATASDGTLSHSYKASYNANGDQITYSWEDESGYKESCTSTYDKFGNLLVQNWFYDYSGDTTTSVVSYTYDADGWLTGMVTKGNDYSETITYTRDDAGNVIREEFTSMNGDGMGYTGTYEYTFDKGNNQTSFTNDWGDTETSTYDKYGNPLTYAYSGGTGYYEYETVKN